MSDPWLKLFSIRQIKLFLLVFGLVVWLVGWWVGWLIGWLKMGMRDQCVKDVVLEIVISMCFSNIIIRIVRKPKREQHFNLSASEIVFSMRVPEQNNPFRYE